ncbi:hypothetical protein LTR94_028657, partial [Friedmanniomyces endolithicus]
REACEAYVLSQAGEGWQALPREYDDGGYSGGSMERPGLKQLMADIAKGEIDIVVVYKVDRLTRSLPDFAKMVEAFDARGVSFVSVTQAFNTTNSMGRLTLNVLLSFAQFEREVTAERIRDKIAASKAKGMWMGGPPPLGYDGVDHRLIPNADEAPTVRMIFERYLELRSVLELQAELKRQGVRSKLRTTKAGKVRGGAVISPGALRLILMNPVYKGALRHKEKLVEGAHAVAAEIGHISLPWPSAEEAPGPACWCGLNGCLETWISGTGFQRDHQATTGRAWAAQAIVDAARAI